MKYRKTFYLIICAGIMSAAILVSINAYKNELFLLAGPIVKRITVKAVNTPELWGPQETKNSKSQAQKIHKFITEELEHLREQRINLNKGSSINGLRQDLSTLLGVLKKCPRDSTKISSNELIYQTPKYQLREITIVNICESDLELYGLLATPLSPAAPPPLMIALHGTASGPEVLFNSWPNTINHKSDYAVDDYHNNMGSVLADAGFAVFAPQLITERRKQPILGFNERRNELHMRSLPLGYTLHGIELTMISSALGCLLADPSIVFDKSKIGAYGVSLGGATAFYLAAIDERIKATVVSNWMEDRDQKLIGVIDAANWRSPSGAYVYQQNFSRKFSDTEMLKLVLPRSLFIEAGIKDGQRAESALEQFLIWKEMFPNYVLDETICMELGEGGHEALLNNSLRWLRLRLLDESIASFKCFTHPEK